MEAVNDVTVSNSEVEEDVIEHNDDVTEHKDDEKNIGDNATVNMAKLDMSQLKTYIGFLIYSVLMIFYLPFYIFGFIMIKRKLWMLKIQRFIGLGCAGKLGLVSRRNRVTDVLVVSTDNEIDFLEHRSMCYLRQMCFRMPWELVKTILRQELIQLVSDEQLAYVVMYTAFANSVAWDDTREMFRLNMEAFEEVMLFQGFYWEARHILVSADGKKLIIQMSDGQEYASDCEERLRPTFELAKLHAQVCLSYFAPGMSHNHVHFVMPSAVAVLSQKHLNRDGILYKLLYQHFRFTERINFQALRVQKATNNKRSQLDRLFFFWQPFPLTKEQFLEGVARKCKKHYVDKGCEECKNEGNHENTSTVGESDGYSSINGGGYHGDIPEIRLEGAEPRSHTLFPPDFVTDKSLQKIPYLNFLAQYYVVIRKFVQSMVPFIDKQEWQTLSIEIAKHVPRFEKANMIDAIATFIHQELCDSEVMRRNLFQVGVIHFCDHNSYTRYFAFRYGSMAIRVPFEPFENKEDWEEFSQEYKFNLEAVKRDPLLLMRQRDVLRTRSFLEIFGDFISGSTLDLQLVNTDYEFDHEGATMAADNFKSQLRSLDGHLKLQDEIMPLSKKEGEQRAEGMRLVPLDDIVRTVCF